LKLETHSRILHGQPHIIAFASFGFDQQLPRSIVDGAHRVRSVPEQVQDDLLKLHPVAYYGWEVIGKFRPQNQADSAKFTQQQ
jgi:hypothetical protein